MKRLDLFEDKKGDEKIMSLWEIFVLMMVGVGIVVGVLVYYSASVDVRETEINLLYEKITLCLNEDGYLADDYFELGNKNEEEVLNIFEKCNLNPNVIFDTSDFYFEARLYDENGIVGEPIVGGSTLHQTNCQILEDTGAKGKEFAKCLKIREPIKFEINGESKNGVLEIRTASNQRGSRISTGQ